MITQGLTVFWSDLFLYQEITLSAVYRIYKEVYHSMAKVELKQPIVEEISNCIKDAEAVVLVNYSGLTVEQDTILRKELREAGIHYKVYKNTMMTRAFAGTDCESLTKHLEGTNALAVSATDATAPARILAKYAKQFPALELIAGVVEGNYNDQAGIQALSQVPSREELLGKLLGSIQSPISNLARVLNQVAEAGGAEAAIAAKSAEA
jgi:large subunit ribosomal protein L10